MQVKRIDFLDKNMRVDKFIRKLYGNLLQSKIEMFLRAGHIKINDQKITSNYRLKEADRIFISSNFLDNIHAQTINKSANKKCLSKKMHELIKKSIIYEDDNFIVINKPSGIAVQGGKNIDCSIDDIFVDAKLVHRLDKDTSGILLLAKTSIIAREISNLFKNRYVKKVYHAITIGQTHNDVGSIASQKNSGVFSKTSYRILKSNDKLSLLELMPYTGRTHQLRIHCADLGTPILGDNKYGNKSIIKSLLIEYKKEEKLYLHAKEIKFSLFNKKFSFEAEYPEYFKEMIHCL